MSMQLVMPLLVIATCTVATVVFVAKCLQMHLQKRRKRGIKDGN